MTSTNSRTGHILVVDNYDSFTYNLVQYLAQLGAEVTVRRNDAITIRDLTHNHYVDQPLAGVLLSPGPGEPIRAGICMDVVHMALAQELTVPLLGVCLGHQAIGAAVGARIDQAPELLHGKTSHVHHTGDGILANMPDPFTATRYHSLAVARETLPEFMQITGETSSGVVMTMRHRKLPIEGVQFHPEAILTQAGHRLLANWLTTCGFSDALRLAEPLVVETSERQILHRL